MKMHFVPIRHLVKGSIENCRPDKSEFHPCKKESNFATPAQIPGVQPKDIEKIPNNLSSPLTNPETNKTDPEPKLTINRQGNRIESIVIECQCGKKVTLNCLYEIFPTNI